jgi:hypothetical protein
MCSSRGGQTVGVQQQEADLRRGSGLDHDADLRRGRTAQAGGVQRQPYSASGAKPDRGSRWGSGGTIFNPDQPGGDGVNGKGQLAGAWPVRLADFGQPSLGVLAHRHHGQVLIQDDHSGSGGVSPGRRGRPDRDGAAQSLGHVRGDAADQVDLAGVEAVRGVLPVQAQDAPAPGLGGQNRAQLVAEAEGAHDLAVAGAGGPPTAGGQVERGDRVGGLRQRGELVDVITSELVVQEQWCCGAKRFVGGCRGEQQGHRVNGREERRVHRQHPV